MTGSRFSVNPSNPVAVIEAIDIAEFTDATADSRGRKVVGSVAADEVNEAGMQKSENARAIGISRACFTRSLQKNTFEQSHK